MNITIGVVADARRDNMGEILAKQVEADYLNVDTLRRGCTWNHATMWRKLAEKPTDWNLVLEDDALPVDEFRDQVAAALAVAPAPIVSLYLGRGYIEDKQMEPLIVRAGLLGANWIVAQGRILHAVALAVRGDLVPDLVKNLPRDEYAIDRSLSLWARRDGHQVAYANPSLVDHADGDSLVTRYRRSERRAWRVGTRDAWCDKMMLMV